MSSTINDLKTPSSGGGVALDYANPVHSFKTDGASYTVPDDGNDYYLCGSLFSVSTGSIPTLSIDSTVFAYGYSAASMLSSPFINTLRLAAGQVVNVQDHEQLYSNCLHIFKAL